MTANLPHHALREYLDADATGRQDFAFPNGIRSLPGLLYAFKIAVMREDDEMSRGEVGVRYTPAKAV